MKLLLLPHARTRVAANLIPKYAKLIETELKVVNPDAHGKFPRSVFLRLAQEAYRRAAEKEDDQVARTWSMYSQVEVISKNINLICSGKDKVDPALESILSYNGIDIKGELTHQP